MQNRKFGMWKKIAVCALAFVLCMTDATTGTVYAAGSKTGTVYAAGNKIGTKAGTADAKTDAKTGDKTDAKSDAKQESTDSEKAATIQLSKTEGTVTVSNSSGKEVKIIKSMRLMDGYHVATEKKSYAWEQLDKSKLIKEDAVSEVEIRKSGKILEILLNSGNMFFNVTEKLSSDETMNICTSSMIAGVRGTCGWVKVIDKMCTRIYLLEGELECVVADPVTGQSKVTRLRGGQWADFYVYDKNQQGDKCDIVMEGFTREDVPGFVLVELAGDNPRCQEIFEDSGIDLRDLTMEDALKRLKEDEEALEDRLKQIEDEVEKQENNISQDPVWEEEKVAKKDPVPGINPPGNKPGDTPGDDNPGGGGGSTGGNTNDDKKDDEKPSNKKKTENVDVTEDPDSVEDLLDEGKDVTVGGDDTSNVYQVDSDLHIPEGTTLAIKNGVTLVVSSAATITVDGTLQAKGDMENNGRVIVNSNKSLHVNGSLTNMGSIINQNQGLVEAAQGIDNYGTINCEGTSTMYSSSAAGTVRMCGVSSSLKIAGGDITNKANGAALALEEATQIGNITFSNETLLQSLTENVLTVGGKKLEVSHYGTSFDSGSGYHQFKIDVKTVTFQGGAGSSVKEVKVISGFPVGSGMPALAKAGHELTGWNLAADGSGTAFTKDTVVEGDVTVYAQWKATTVTHTVTFNANGGKLDEKTATVLHGSTVELPTPIAPDDYAFFGWYTAKNSKGTKITGSEAITADVTYYARWVPANVALSVTFNLNDGTGAIASVQSVNAGNKAAKPADPKRTGYVFGGWYTDASCTKAYDFNTAVTASFSLYAKWTIAAYKVTFHANGGTMAAGTAAAASETAEVTVNYGEKVAKPEDPARAGCTFEGWYADAKGETAYDFNATVTADITIYAKWTVNTNKVIFNANGGTMAAAAGAAAPETLEITVNSGDKVTKPEDPIRDGFVFVEWCTDAEGTATYDFNAAVTADITLYAKWTVNRYVVTFDSQGGSAVAAQTVNGNETAEEPTAPTRVGYTFEGWYTEATCETKYKFSTPVSANITLYAKWAVKTYTVTFHANGGSFASATGAAASETVAQTVNHGEKVTKPVDPILTGNSVSGWYTDAACTIAYDFTKPVEGPLTLYAKWELKRYEVTFDTDGGSNVAAQTVEYGKKVTKPATDPTKTGCEFGGWYKDADCKTAWNFDTDTVTEDTTIYARWKTAHTVRLLDIWGNELGETLDPVMDGEKIRKADMPTPYSSGYSYVWFKNYTTRWDFDTDTVTKDMDLMALEVEDGKHVVIVDPNLGSLKPVEEFRQCPPFTVYDGYEIYYYDYIDDKMSTTFVDEDGYPYKADRDSWYTTKELTPGSEWDFNKDTVTGDITLYAKWTKPPIG